MLAPRPMSLGASDEMYQSVCEDNHCNRPTKNDLQSQARIQMPSGATLLSQLVPRGAYIQPLSTTRPGEKRDEMPMPLAAACSKCHVLYVQPAP